MREAGATRDTQLWAVGGGAIQDVAGFVSSIYMRGISWIYIPTTLLGMADSCIGGKSSINVGQHKNIVGSFHTPTAVLIDTTLTSTLTVEQKMSGLIEAAKICYCRGADAFDEYLSLDPGSASTPDHFEPIVTLSLRSKKWFVETDEFDRAERLLLNLGHTFGHALESASNFRLSHGMAVGVGILCAVALSGELLTISPRGSVARLVEHIRALLACLPNLANVLRAIDPPSTLDRLKADKKHQTEHYRFVTFDVSGRVHVVRLPKNTETHAKIANALCNTLELLSA
jgi:3-dehydroquinate synthase